jgi:Tol biopolymer transport system component
MKSSVFLAVFLTLVSSDVFAASGPFTSRVAFTTDRDGNTEIYTVNASGSGATRLTNDPAIDSHPSFSPDGKKIAFTSDRDGNNEVYVMNANGTDQTRLTNDPASDSQPTWSSDGARIVFQSTRGGGFDIFIMNANGTGVTQLTNDPGFDVDPSFSPAGNKIAFVSSRDGNHEIYLMNPDGTNQTRLTNNTFFEVRPDFSPNGTKVVFARNLPDVGRQIVTMNVNGANQTVLTSAGANGNPAFSPDGNRIFFDSTRDLGATELYSMAADGSDQVRMTNNAFSDALPTVQGVFRVETMAVYRPSTGQWILALENASSPITVTVNFGGQPGDLPVTGNWDGDTRTDIGVFRNGTFHLAVLKKQLLGQIVVQELAPVTFGQAGDLPLAGDWDGDGKDDVGVFRPGTTGRFLLRQPRRVSAPFSVTIITTIAFDFGTTGDRPVAGDWNGDDIETPGVYRSGDPGPFLLTNGFTGVVDATFNFGSVGDLPLAGDWLGEGTDRVGLFLPNNPLMILATDLSKAGIIAVFGQPGDLPVAGHWSF